MIKVEVIEKFTLKRFGEIKNLKRKADGKEGELRVGDTFECSKDLANYLTGDNALNKTVVRVIEVEPEKVEIETEKEPEEIVEEKPKSVKHKKNKRK